MDIDEAETPERRGVWARLGIVALNLLVPGLGLLRVGERRWAAMCLAAPFALFLLIGIGVGLLPITSYHHALFAVMMIPASYIAIYAVPMVLTWRKSRFRRPAGPWSRWYSLVAVGVLALFLFSFVAPTLHRFYKPFRIPSNNMLPTLQAEDKIMVQMSWRGPVSRGQVILFSGPGGVRVDRVVAVGGDKVAMVAGVPVVNGRKVEQHRVGQMVAEGLGGLQKVAVMSERLPGELTAHKVLDAGPSPFENFPEAIVPAGHIFVLGDHRDDSADSRVPAEYGGVGMVPLTALAGRPMYVHWSQDRARIGTRFDW